ncbi:hypothetical protein COL5a_003929 [Colletotrichum fioriniae]|nr:uncharacterized protein COL516b_000004 [Colletotrichum fioriniae]KAJ0313079.1 hypothetical protein COL516b_000004 [Colletotrichum fioriniae]KAJ0329373.1 hypothetical protein COL5a_003929 [Colletotrichum fioriniae]
MDSPGRQSGTSLADLIRTSQLLTDRYSTVANSLNTAPVTLSDLAKECRAVTDALRRFKYLRETIPETLVFDPVLLDQSCQDALDSINTDLLSLDFYSTRIRPATSDSAVDMSSGQITIIWNEDSLRQIQRQLKTNRQSLTFLLNCVPRPPPGILYKQSMRTTKDLHDGIDRGDEAAVVKLLLQRIDPNAPRFGSKLCPLRRALNRQIPSLVTFIAIAGADLESRGDEGDTILITAIKYGYSDKVVSLLCELGADVNAVDTLGCSAVHYAAMSAKDDTLEVLIRAGGEVDRRDLGTRTPLIAAVQNYRFNAIEKLLEYGADLEARLQNGRTALHVAISMRSSPMTEFLSDQGAYLDRRVNEHTALTYAISTACPDIAEVLIGAGADVNLPSSKGNFPLLAAASAGDLLTMKLLLSRGANFDATGSEGYLPIHMAAHKNRVEVLQLLFKAGSQIDPTTEHGETPLTIAMHLGCFEAAQYLIEVGAEVDHSAPGAERIICQALKAGNTRIAMALIRGGADLTTPLLRNSSMTPLHLAAHYGQNDVLATMISTGVDLDTRTWPGFTPLFAAVRAGHLDTVRLLLAAGAYLRARSMSGANLMFFGTAYPAMIKLLMDLGLDVRERDHHGATPLHYAAVKAPSSSLFKTIKRKRSIVKVLLQASPDRKVT